MRFSWKLAAAPDTSTPVMPAAITPAKTVCFSRRFILVPPCSLPWNGDLLRSLFAPQRPFYKRSTPEIAPRLPCARVLEAPDLRARRPYRGGRARRRADDV